MSVTFPFFFFFLNTGVTFYQINKLSKEKKKNTFFERNKVFFFDEDNLKFNKKK